MNRCQSKICSAALLPSVVTMLSVPACGGGGDALAQQAADPADANACTGDTRSQVRDIAGVVLTQTCVTDAGNRSS